MYPKEGLFKNLPAQPEDALSRNGAGKIKASESA